MVPDQSQQNVWPDLIPNCFAWHCLMLRQCWRHYLWYGVRQSTGWVEDMQTVGRRLNWLLVGVYTVCRVATAKKNALMSSMIPLATIADPDQM